MALGKGLRIFLIVVGAVVLLVALLIGGFAWWLSSNKDELKAMGDRIKAEATGFGQGRNGEACLAEGLRQLDACDGMMCAVKTRVFLTACLEVAEPSPDLCKGVPSSDSIVNSVMWLRHQCAEVQIDTDDCQDLFGELQDFCHDE
ncbi:MAG: hypothetical protein OEM67_00270 [Thermoleophilia bacterium]|nr:hypothetical protein [Thermoleophilia bacterium]